MKEMKISLGERLTADNALETQNLRMTGFDELLTEGRGHYAFRLKYGYR